MYKWPPRPFDIPIDFDIPISFAMFPPFVMLDSFAIPFSFSSWLKLDPLEVFRTRSKLFGFVSVAENRVELHPSHVGLGDEGLVATGAFGRGCLLGRRGIRKRVMSEVEKTPSVRRSEPLAVFNRHIHSVVFAVEISSAGWFRARAVWKGWIENARQ